MFLHMYFNLCFCTCTLIYVFALILFISQINDDALGHIGTHCKQLITLNVYGCKVIWTLCVWINMYMSE